MKNSVILRSWKEIADFLGYDGRSCRRWEIRLGLPVHRIGGSKRSSVFAYKEELETWLKGHQGQITPQIEYKVSKKDLLSGFNRKAVFAILIIAGLSFLLFFTGHSKGEKPADFDIIDSKLIVLSDNGKKLWDIDTKTEYIVTRDTYRHGHFQKREKNQSTALLPYLIIKDIDDNGEREVLFTVKTTNDLGEGILFCFDQSGEERWKYDTGIALKYGNKIYSADYKIRGFDIHDFDGDGRMEIVIIACHFTYFPCRIIVLDSNGILRGDFYNSGHINDFVFADVNEDGRAEIVAGGVNNEYEKACIIVLDTTKMNGGSPQAKDYYTCRELQPGTEVFYALLPRTCVDLKFPYPGESVNFVEILKGGRIQTQTYLSGIYYEFDYNLHPQDARKSPLFSQRWEESITLNRSAYEAGPEFWSSLLTQIQYWNGNQWVGYPEINRGWLATKTGSN